MAAEPDEDVPPEFECSICMKLLLEPVSVPCGHTFCRACLEQSLGYRGLCAVCRAPVAGVQGVNILLRGIVAERFPRALARRKRELEEELRAGEQEAEEARRREARGASSGSTGATGGPAVAPVMPLMRNLPSPALPYCRVDLEFRTAAEVGLLDFALQGSRRIGVLDDDKVYDEGARPFGVCVEIEDVHRQQGVLPRVTAMGKFRFRIVEPPQVHEEGGFELGRCEAFFDTQLPLSDLVLSPPSAPGAETDEAEQTAADQAAPEPSLPEVARAALELLDRQLVHVGAGGRHDFSMRFGPTPVLRTTGTTTSTAMEQLSFWLLGALVMDEADRKNWLASVDTRGRLEAARQRLQIAGNRPVLNLPGARSWMNPGQSALSSLALLVGIIALLLAKALGAFEQRSRGSVSSASAMEDAWAFAQLLR